MAKERTSVRMQIQIKIMSEQGHSIRTVARVLKLSRCTVRKYFAPAPLAAEKTGGWEEQIDWDYVRQEVSGKETTIKQIGQEVAPEIDYVKFWRAYWEYARAVASPRRCDHSTRSSCKHLKGGVLLTPGLFAEATKIDVQSHADKCTNLIG